MPYVSRVEFICFERWAEKCLGHIPGPELPEVLICFKQAASELFIPIDLNGRYVDDPDYAELTGEYQKLFKRFQEIKAFRASPEYDDYLRQEEIDSRWSLGHERW